MAIYLICTPEETYFEHKGTSFVLFHTLCHSNLTTQATSTLKSSSTTSSSAKSSSPTSSAKVILCQLVRLWFLIN